MNRHTACRRRLAVAFALLLLLASCGGDNGDDDEGASEDPDTTEPDPGDGPDDEDVDAEGTPQYGGTLVIGLEGDTTNLLPGTGQFATSGVSIAMTIYDPLVTQNADGELEPNLAESLEPNEDLTEWTMTLRPDIEFHDGSPFDAETLVWNFETLHDVDTANTYGAVQNAGITGVEAVDDLTVVWTLSGPNSAFPDALRGPLGWPVSREAYEAMGADALAEAPVGTGPFVFVDFTRDDRFVARRNENYWRTDADGNQLPYLDEVIFRPIPDEQTRVQSLASDTVQVVSTLRGSAIKDLMAMEEEGGFGGNLFVGNVSGASIFNTMVPPVDDVRIRRALAFASEPESVAIVLGDDGLVPATTQFFSPDSPWYSDNVAQAYPGSEGRELETAIELVEDYRADPDRSDGGAPGDPIEIVYSCPPDPSLIEIGQLLQRLWGEAGVVVQLEQVEQPELISNAIGGADQNPPWSGNYMVNCWRAGVESDPLTTFQSWFGPQESTPTNFTNFTQPDIDEALETLRTSVDFETRYEAVESIGLILAEEVPISWGVGTATYVAWRDDVHGLATWRTAAGNEGRSTYDGRVILHQAWIEQ